MNNPFYHIEDYLRKIIREELQQLRPTVQPSTQELVYLSMKQAMDRYDCKRSLLHRLSSTRAVTTRKVGRNLHFLAADLEAYFNKKIKQSVTAINGSIAATGLFPTLGKSKNSGK